MSPLRGRGRIAGVLVVAALAGGLLVAAGTGSTARSWTWEGGAPGPRVLIAEGDLALVAATPEDGTVEVGTDATAALQPVADLAGDDPVVAFAAAAPDGGPQRLVGVARSDVDRVEAVLRDGSTRELPLNEWRAFSYSAPTPSESAIGLVGSAGGSEVGIVRVPQTTTTTPPPSLTTAYTISNRGRLVASNQTRDLFDDRPYRLYLLASRNGRAYYRVQVTNHYTCWAAGKASRIGEIEDR